MNKHINHEKMQWKAKEASSASKVDIYHSKQCALESFPTAFCKDSAFSK